MVKRTVLVCALVALTGISCVPEVEPPPVLEKDYGPNTTMGAIQERGVLRVGLSEVEPLADLTEDLAAELARILAVDLETVAITPEDVHVRLAEGDIDVGFPLKPLTETVVRRNAVTDPYFVTYQRVLAPAGTDAADLSGSPVCITNDEPVTIDVGRATRGSIEDCARGLVDGTFEAASGLEVELIAVLVRRAELHRSSDEQDEIDRAMSPFEIQGDALSTAGLSAFVPTGASDLVTFLEQAVDEYVGSGQWMDAFEEVLGGLDGPASLPDITAEEAAALFPR